ARLTRVRGAVRGIGRGGAGCGGGCCGLSAVRTGTCGTGGLPCARARAGLAAGTAMSVADAGRRHRERRMCACMLLIMSHYRISEAAELLGVSNDTVRRQVDSGALTSSHDDAGRLVIPGDALARWAQERAASPHGGAGTSARNRFTGLVTAI